MKNRNKKITSQIDNALLNFEMNDVTRELLIKLRDEVPKAKTEEERLQIAFKWIELISTVVTIVSAVHSK